MPPQVWIICQMNRQKAKLQGKKVGIMAKWLDMFHELHVQIQPGLKPITPLSSKQFRATEKRFFSDILGIVNAVLSLKL